jgi:hypothetical protein
MLLEATRAAMWDIFKYGYEYSLMQYASDKDTYLRASLLQSPIE